MSLEDEVRKLLSENVKKAGPRALRAIARKIAEEKGDPNVYTEAFKVAARILGRPKLIVDGKRIDGRSPDELRTPLRIEVGVLSRADGSALIEWGKNKIVVGVYGPRPCIPKHEANPYRALVKARYNMAPFSTPEERIRPGPTRRSVEISKLLEEALSSVILLEEFPGAQIEVYVEVLQSDGGTRVASLTAASVALAQAGIPMLDLISAVAVGKVDGQIVIDLNKDEDNWGEVDMPLAILPRTRELVFLQTDGLLTKEEYKEALKLGIKGALQIYEVQKEALKRRYML